jgi:hypothetical protein
MMKIKNEENTETIKDLRREGNQPFVNLYLKVTSHS